MKKHGWYLLILILLYLSLSMVDNAFIFTDDFINRSLSEDFSESVIEALLTNENQFKWIGYALLPVIILLKILFTSFCVTTGAILTDTDFTFKKIFQTASCSEYIFWFSQAIFYLRLILNRDYLTLDNAGNYFPLSLLSYFGTDNVVSWLHYPLQTLNLFEVFYVLLISWFLSKQWKPNFVESLSIVIPSYGIGLLLWMALVVFLTLQIS